MTGPSFTSSTAIRAPKTPVSTVDAELAQRGAEPLVERLGQLGPARRREKLGRLPFAVSAISVNWLTTSAAPPVSSSERSNFPSSFSKIRSRATFAGEPLRVGRRRRRAATPSSTQSPAPIAPPGVDDRRARRRAGRRALHALARGRGCARRTSPSPASSSSRACSGRSPRRRGPASRARGRARSARSRRSGRARRAIVAELALGLVPAARAGSRRSRAPRGSTPSPARAASPSRAAPSPARSSRFGAASGLRGRGRTRRSSQVREVLAHQVNG